jgi:integrase
MADTITDMGMADGMTKEKRRQYGTGSVYQRSSDGRWMGVIQAGWNANGTRRRITATASTEAECKRRLKAKQREIEAEGLPTAGVSKRATVKSWAETWLDLQQHKVRPKTWATTKSQINVWVVPTIGHKRLDTLTPGDVRSVAGAIRRAGRSSSTALRCQVVLTKMLADAVIEGHQIPQRVLMLDNPTVGVSDRDAIPLPDALAMLNIAAGQVGGSRWVAAFLQGMRQGECLGLCWEAVSGGTVDVSWQLQAIPYMHGCGRDGNKQKCGRRFGGDCPDRGLRVPDGYEYRQLDGNLCLVRPKTEKGQRVIPLVPWMVDALAAWRTVAPASPHGLVWPRLDGRPRTSAADREDWHQLQDDAGVQGPGRYYHLHEARHTTATLLLEVGVDPEVVKSVLGHSSIVTSRGYQHVSQTMARKAMEQIAEKLQLTSGE